MITQTLTLSNEAMYSKVNTKSRTNFTDPGLALIGLSETGPWARIILGS